MAKAVSSIEVKHAVKTDLIMETTPNHGIVIDGVTVKDGALSSTGLSVTSGAAVGLVLKCDNAGTGHASWQTDAAGLVLEVENVTTTPYTITNTAMMSEIVAAPITEHFHVTLPLIVDRRLMTVRNTSAIKNVILHSTGTNTIWDSTLIQLTIPPNSVTSLEGANGVWFAY